MLNAVFWRHVPLEIEFKNRGSEAMHSGNTHEREPNFRPMLSTRKKKENRKTERGEFIMHQSFEIPAPPTSGLPEAKAGKSPCFHHFNIPL